MTPEWGCCARDLPPETQFLLVQLADSGPYAVLLPLVDSGKFRVTLRPPTCAASRVVLPVAVTARPPGQLLRRVRPLHALKDATCATALHDRRNEGRDLLRLRVESGNKDVAASEWDSVLLIAAGCDPYALVDAAVVEAARLSGGCRLSSAVEIAAILEQR